MTMASLRPMAHSGPSRLKGLPAWSPKAAFPYRPASTLSFHAPSRPRSRSQIHLTPSSTHRPMSLSAISSLNPFPTFATVLGDLLIATPTPSYALSIVVLTLCLRSGITVPATLWQRARLKRLREHVMPAVKRINTSLAVQVMRESRARGLDYEAYRAELKRQLANEQSALHKKHKTHPTITLLAPLAVHIPLLIATSMSIRHAIEIPASPLAAEVCLWFATLGEPDPTGILPILGGVVAFANAEIVGLKRVKEAAEITAAERAAANTVLGHIADPLNAPHTSPTYTRPTTSTNQIAPSSTSASPLTTRSQPPKLSPHLTRRKLSTTSPTLSLSPTAPVAQPLPPARRRAAVAAKNIMATPDSNDESRARAARVSELQTRLVAGAMRGGAILFIPLAAMMPTALVIYWVTSMTFSLCQNIVLGRLDRRDLAKRIAAKRATAEFSAK